MFPITLACVILPVIGAQGFFEHFRQPYSWTAHVELLFPQLVAPVLLLLLEGLFGYCAFYGKRIPLWVLIFGLVGAGGMGRDVGYASHDFSHVIFAECSDVYGNVILWLAGLTALFLVVIWLLEIRNLEKLGCLFKGVKLKWKSSEKGTRRVLGLLSIVACGIATLYLLVVL